jgi:CheY-like chemotaxis protein
MLEILVRDTGKGMCDSRLDDLLTVDRTSSGSDSAATGSTLRLCARLAATMGGKLTGRSEPFKGTEFTLVLPLERTCRSTEQAIDGELSKFNWILVDKAQWLPPVIGGFPRLRRLSAPQVISNPSGSDNVVWIVQDERDMENCIHAARRAENPDAWHVFLPRREYGRMLPWCKAVAIEPYVRPVMPSHVTHMISQRLRSNDYRKKPRTLGINVLVAEDNQVCSTVLSAVLRKWNCRFVVVENGQEALNRLAEKPEGYDAILMNCEMPVMDGFVATQILRGMQDEFPAVGRVTVIGMSSSSDSDVVARAIKAGMDDCLRKPLRFNALYDILERCLSERPLSR